MQANRQIDRLQNEDHSTTLFRAIAVAHRYTQRVQALSLIVSLILAGLSIVAKAAYAPALPAITVAGAIWAGTYAVALAPLVGRYLGTSATLQEMVDVDLFGLRWNTVLVGDRLSDDEVSRLSRRFRADPERFHDYYLVAAVVAPYDVLFCLEQNLAWGSRVRRRYAQVLLGVVAAWWVAAVAVGVATNSTVGNLLDSWLLPSLGLLLVCLDIARAQISSSKDRERVLRMVRAALDDRPLPTTDHMTFARHVQDALFLVRRQQPRIPQWLFRLFHESDMADFRYKMEALEGRHGLNGPPGP